MARPKGATRRCSKTEPRARVIDSRAFLDAADITDNADVKATNAIHAAIAAADAICCVALHERSADGNHGAATDLLRRVEPKLANTLARLLDIKSQAAYEERNVSAAQATATVKGARQLLDAAEDRLLDT